MITLSVKITLKILSIIQKLETTIKEKDRKIAKLENRMFKVKGVQKN